MAVDGSWKGWGQRKGQIDTGLTLGWTPASPGGCDRTQFPGLTLRISASIDLSWGPSICVSNKFPSAAVAVGPKTTLRMTVLPILPLLYRIRCKYLCLVFKALSHLPRHACKGSLPRAPQKPTWHFVLERFIISGLYTFADSVLCWNILSLRLLPVGIVPTL